MRAAMSLAALAAAAIAFLPARATPTGRVIAPTVLSAEGVDGVGASLKVAPEFVAAHGTAVFAIAVAGSGTNEARLGIAAWEGLQAQPSQLRPASDYFSSSAQPAQVVVWVYTEGRTEAGAGPDALFVLKNSSGAESSTLTGDAAAADVEAALQQVLPGADGVAEQLEGGPGQSAWQLSFMAPSDSVTAALAAGAPPAAFVSATVVQERKAATVAVLAPNASSVMSTAPVLPEDLHIALNMTQSGLLERQAGVNSTGPLLAASQQWLALGVPSLLGGRGTVVVWARQPSASAEAAPLSAPRLITPSTQSLAARSMAEAMAANATALSTGPNPWLSGNSAATSEATDNAAGPGGPMSQLLLPSLSNFSGPALGAAVALDGSWLAVAAPSHRAASNAETGGFAVFGLSADGPGGAPRAVLSLSASVPDSMLPFAALSGPHPGARLLGPGLRSQPLRCGSSLALGGGFLVVGCPGLSMPATATSPAMESTGGLLVLRQARPANASAVAEAWPGSSPESATQPAELRGEAPLTARAGDSAVRPAEELVRSAAWVVVQVLVPLDARPGMRLGAGSGAAVDDSDAAGDPNATVPTGRGAMLAVSSRFVVAAAPGTDVVVAWRRRNGRARGFDPASQQTLRALAGQTGHAVVVAGVQLLGPRIAVSLAGSVSGMAGPVPLVLFRADALGFFYDQGEVVAAGAQARQPGLTFGLSADRCAGGLGVGIGAAVATAEGASPMLRLLAACRAAGPSAEATIALLDSPARCPDLADPAAVLLTLGEGGPPVSIATARSLHATEGGEGMPSSLCGDVAPRSPLLAGSVPINASAIGGSAGSDPAPGVAVTAAAPGWAEQCAQGTTAGGSGGGEAVCPAPPACGIPCAYGSSLASGAQLAACEATAVWSLFPDELPTCEPLLAVSPRQAAPKAPQRLSASDAPGSLGPVAQPGLPTGGRTDVPRLSLLASLLLASPIQQQQQQQQGSGAQAEGTVSSLGWALQGAVRPALPAGFSQVEALASVLGASRAVDGTFAAARGASAVAPVLSGQASLPAPSRAPGNVSATQAGLPAVTEASGGYTAAPPNHTEAPLRASQEELRAQGLAVALAAAAAGLLSADTQPSTRGATTVPPSALQTALSGVRAALLLPRSTSHSLAAELVQPVRGRRHNVTACAEDEERCGAVPAGAILPGPAGQGPATHPSQRWSAPAETLDPLRRPLSLPAQGFGVAGPAQRAADENATVAAFWSAAGARGVSAGLRHLGAASGPLLRFAPPNRSTALQPGAAAPLGARPDAAGSLLLSDGDMLSAEALLAPMTWQGGSQDVDVLVTADGAPALGGSPLAATLPLRVCCQAGRGREPASASQAEAGPRRARVRLAVPEGSSYTLSSAVDSADYNGPTLLDAVMAMASLRLGNVSQALRLAGASADIVPPPVGAQLGAGGGTGWAQGLGAGTAALDVPGASIELVGQPSDAWSAYDTSGTATTSVHPVIGRELPYPSGAFVDFALTGFGTPWPDAGNPCADLATQAEEGGSTGGTEPTPPTSDPELAVVAVRGGYAPYDSSSSWRLADDIALQLVRAAGMPVTWWERRGCVAADRRSLAV